MPNLSSRYLSSSIGIKPNDCLHLDIYGLHTNFLDYSANAPCPPCAYKPVFHSLLQVNLPEPFIARDSIASRRRSKVASRASLIVAPLDTRGGNDGTINVNMVAS